MQPPAKTARWAKCLAISVLAGLSVGILTIAVASFFFYRHYTSQFPADTQNILSALTSGMVVGIGVGAVAAVATAGIYLLYGMVGHRPEQDETKKAVDS
jgi:ABC-type Fe3+ transport system permease subunit